MTDNPVVLATSFAYFAVVVLIGLWAARRTRTARDFFIAGQDVGLLVMSLATMSAIFSGFVFIGGPGLTYRMGLASLFISASVSFTAALLGWTVARRLRLLAEVREVYTVPDAIAARFRGTQGRLAAGLAAVAVVLGVLGYLGAQLQALGVMVEAIFGWSLPVAMAVGCGVVLLYATLGGMVAGVYTDVFQGALMLGTAVAVVAHALDAGGGLETMARTIASSEAFGPSFLDPLGRVPVMTAIGFFFVFGVGSLGQPQTLHKFYMLDDPRKLKWFPLVLGVAQTLVVMLWLAIGLAVPALVAGGRMTPLARPDDATPLFVLGHTPPWLAGLVFAGVLAAIMSTADSFVNIASAALVRDLPKAFGREPRDELRRGRLAVVLVTVAAAVFAHLYSDLIALLGTFAFGTLAAALTPTLVVGLNWRRVNATAASASIATGLAVNLGLELLPSPPLAAGVLPSAVAMTASFAVLLAVSWGTREEPLDEDVEAVLAL